MEARVEIDRGVAHGVDEQGIEQRGLRTPKAQAAISGLGCRGERQVPPEPVLGQESRRAIAEPDRRVAPFERGQHIV